GLALAPWERPSEIPPEKDGFFLLQLVPPAAAAAPPAGAAAATGAAPGAPAPRPQSRPPVSLAILFDTSLRHRWSGLETAYAHLVRVLQSLDAKDRFAVIPFDRTPGEGTLQPATREAVEGALSALRSRALGPGSDVAQALAAGRRVAGERGRLLLLSDGPAGVSSRGLSAARGTVPLFTALTGEETPEAYRAASTALLVPGATEIEGDLFFQRVIGPLEKPAPPAPKAEKGEKADDEQLLPFTVSGGEPMLRDIYPILV